MTPPSDREPNDTRSPDGPSGETRQTVVLGESPASGGVDPYVGRELDGRFRIVERVGAGGMSFVYRAEQLAIGRAIALKLMRPERELDERQIRQFEDEARMAGSIDHPNAVNVLDAGRFLDGTRYIAMELVEGRNLRAVLEEEGALDEARVRTIARQVAEALAAAHRRGFVHSDLKPENVMIERDRHGHAEWVKVLDFGIAVPVGSPGASSSAAAPGLLVGTPRYMSPEQCRGEPLDPRSDVYSMGVMMYEMLVGETPFHGGNVTTRGVRSGGTARHGSAVSVMAKHVQGGVPALRGRRPDIQLSREFEKLVMRALSKEPSWRFRDGSEMVEAFERLHRLDTAAERSMSSGAAGPIARRRAAPREDPASDDGARRPLRVALGLGAVAVVALASLYLAFLRPGAAPGPGSDAAASPAASDPPSMDAGAGPGVPDIRQQLDEAARQISAGHPAAASEIYDRVRRLEPDNVEAWVGLGRSTRDLEQPEQALFLFERALAIADAEPDPRWRRHLDVAVRERAEILANDRLRREAARAIDAGDRAAALERLERYTAARPWDRAARLDLGRVLLEERRFEEAVEQLDAVVRLDPLQPEPHLELGRAWLSLDRLEEAETELEAAVRLAPAMEEARRLLERVRRRR